MCRQLIFSLGALQVLLSLTLPATAQKVASFELDQQCQAAVQSARTKLESKRDLKTIVNVHSLAAVGAEYPEGRSLSIGLTLRGSASSSIMRSPQMMKSISTGVIMNCQTVSTVTFGVFPTDWSTTYGLMAENRVEEFKCLSSRNISEGIPYGYEVCL